MTWKEGVNYTLMNLADDAILGDAVSSSKHRKLTQKGPSEIRNTGTKQQKELRLGQMRASAAGRQTQVCADSRTGHDGRAEPAARSRSKTPVKGLGPGAPRRLLGIRAAGRDQPLVSEGGVEVPGGSGVAEARTGAPSAQTRWRQFRGKPHK